MSLATCSHLHSSGLYDPFSSGIHVPHRLFSLYEGEAWSPMDWKYSRPALLYLSVCWLLSKNLGVLIKPDFPINKVSSWGMSHVISGKKNVATISLKFNHNGNSFILFSKPNPSSVATQLFWAFSDSCASFSRAQTSQHGNRRKQSSDNMGPGHILPWGLESIKDGSRSRQ